MYQPLKQRTISGLGWKTTFQFLEHSVQKLRTTFSDVPLFPEISHREDTKRCYLYFLTRFFGNFLKMANDNH